MHDRESRDSPSTLLFADFKVMCDFLASRHEIFSIIFTFFVAVLGSALCNSFSCEVSLLVEVHCNSNFKVRLNATIFKYNRIKIFSFPEDGKYMTKIFEEENFGLLLKNYFWTYAKRFKFFFIDLCVDYCRL